MSDNGTLRLPPTRIQLQSRENADYARDIQTRLDAIFEGCRVLNRPILFQGNKEYTREIKGPGGLYRIVRKRGNYCSFEFPYQNRLSIVKTGRDGTGFEGWFPAEKSNDSFGCQSNGDLLSKKDKIDTAVAATESAFKQLNEFVQTETAGKVGAVTANVSRIMESR